MGGMGGCKDLVRQLKASARLDRQGQCHPRGSCTTAPPGRQDNKLNCANPVLCSVNAKVGQVTLHFITGTTGMSAQRDGKNYKVRA